jgi:hypothetical protein
MSDQIDDDFPVQDELETLKSRATLLGIAFHPSIGLDKLRAKVNDAATATAPEVATAPQVSDAAPVETESQYKARMRRDANKLVRIRVNCMNPAKAEWEGELFTAGNSVVGSFTKFVPFNEEEGWHVPHIIYEMMKERQCQIFITKTDSKGNSVRTGKLIKEFAMEILDPLTVEELQELARRQAAKNSVEA